MSGPIGRTNSKSIDELISECEKEPIHIPGCVQPHGILITLRSSDLTILQISESVFELMGIHHTELLHQPLSRLMPTDPVERATKRLGDRIPRLLNPIPIIINVRGNEVKFDGILHRAGRVLILELEKHIAEDRGYGGFGGFYEAIREVTSRMMVTENLSEVLELACQELRKLTGFDRVLVYRFDSEWNGEVINESKDETVATLLHHRFPASDIPKQARDLYTSNWLRLIPNATYQPSPVIPTINPITDKPLDMSNSVLRSVSPVHLEYMRNMGQVASMSVSLLKGRTLWGLISCHHSSPLYLKYDVRVAAEFIGQMVSAQIIAREENAEVDHKLQLKKLYDDLLHYGGGYAAISQALSQNATSLLGLVDANGAAICVDGRFNCVGATPGAEELTKIYEWVLQKNVTTFSTSNLTKASEGQLQAQQVATGIFAIVIPRTNHRDVILWFRPEIRSQVKWAGDPGQAKVASPDGKIHPRKSFETWFENTAGMAKQWAEPEIDAAEELRALLTAMSLGYESSPEAASKSEAFRNSLTNSIATTRATQGGRNTGTLGAPETPSLSEVAYDSRLLLEGFSEFAVLFLDLDGRVQSWSSGARRILGYESAEVLGKSLNFIFSEEESLAQKLEGLLGHVSRRGRCEEELWLYRVDQTSFWGKVLIAKVRDQRGEHRGYSVVVEDVTREKSAEEELKSMKLTAEAANRAKSAFLANISHEIRTPLGAVLGFSELMSARNLPDDEKIELYGKVKRNGDQLTVLINDLLDLSKVESGKIDIERITTDFELLLEDIEQLFSIKALERNICLKIAIKDPIPKCITTDPTRLRQILINLVNNAIKFTPSGGSVELLVALESGANGQMISLRITDSGRGMTELEMEKLFQPFAQADASTTREYGGTGLGLFLSKRLARALGGDLSIEWSKPGKGSCFIFYFNPGEVRSDKRFTKIGHRSATPANSNLFSSALKGKKILVVDDSEDNRELIETYLTMAGAQVTLTENGRKGVDAALTQEFDVVLMDIQMPVLDGNEAIKLLMKSGYQKPVIALTAHAMREERDYSLASGFKDYLTKPIDRKHLISRLEELHSSPQTL